MAFESQLKLSKDNISHTLILYEIEDIQVWVKWGTRMEIWNFRSFHPPPFPSLTTLYTVQLFSILYVMKGYKGNKWNLMNNFSKKWTFFIFPTSYF